MRKHSFMYRHMANSGGSRQRGATLIIGLIMLVIITLIVLNAYNSSSTNLKSVGNMQSKAEATAAANSEIERVINLDFTNLTLPESNDVHIDKNATTTPYHVVVTVEGCKSRTVAPSSEAVLSGVGSNIVNTNDYDTVWELKAVVSDASTGTSVTTVQGIRQRMAQTNPNLAKCN